MDFHVITPSAGRQHGQNWAKTAPTNELKNLLAIMHSTSFMGFGKTPELADIDDTHRQASVICYQWITGNRSSQSTEVIAWWANAVGDASLAESREFVKAFMLGAAGL